MILGQQHIQAGQEGRKVLRGAFGVAVMLSLALGTAGCGMVQGKNKSRSESSYEGFGFKSRAATVGEDRSHFRVEVRRATQSLDGAKASGHHAGTRYCIEQYGSSKIDWISGPYQENDTLVLDGDQLIMEGICVI